MRSCARVRDNKEELHKTFNELWSLCLILSAISFGVFCLSVLLVRNLQKDIILLAIFGISILLQSVNCEWLYKGLEKFLFLAVVTFACKVISLIGIILFVKSSQDVVIYAVLSVLIAHGSNIVFFLLRKKYIDSKITFTVNFVHLKPLLVFFMMSFAVSVYNNMDLTMLGFIKTEHDVGIYSIASKGKSVLAMTGGCFCSVFFFAPMIIRLIGGVSYSGAVPSFRILLFSLFPIAMSNILGGQVLIPAGMEKKLLLAEICGAVFNFLDNLFAIPRYSIEGAALTTVISEIIVWLLCVFFCKRELEWILE